MPGQVLDLCPEAHSEAETNPSHQLDNRKQNLLSVIQMVSPVSSLMGSPGHFLCAWSRKPEGNWEAQRSDQLPPTPQLCGVLAKGGWPRGEHTFPQGSDLYESHLLI